ncbi:hypothetical protein [Candidatus Albibeggiatoa sp. nov. BB20]|uniref:hypothetical protein n=1 Tax=Candidatus Albibeggiatoa sp. nov. BB20 TaxID=3162723 RepID=UPI003365A7A3
MDNDIYQAPQAVITDNSDNTRGSPVKAIFLGIVIEYIVALILIIIFTAIYAFISINYYGATLELLRVQLEELDDNIFSILWFSMFFIGMCCSLLAGYICARTVKQDIYKYTLILALCCTGFNLIVDLDSALREVVFGMLTLVAMLGGAYIYQFTQAETVGNE